MQRRDRLEALQVELREAQAALDRAKTDSESAPIAAMREAVARAEGRRQEVEAEHQALLHEADDLEREAQQLKKDIDEEQLLLRGATKRDDPGRWDSVSMGRNQGNTSPAAAVALSVLYVVAMAIAFLAGRHH